MPGLLEVVDIEVAQAVQDRECSSQRRIDYFGKCLHVEEVGHLKGVLLSISKVLTKSFSNEIQLIDITSSWPKSLSRD